MKWATREHPTIDRIACPWLIRRLVEADAAFLDVPQSSRAIRARAGENHADGTSVMGRGQSPQEMVDGRTLDALPQRAP